MATEPKTRKKPGVKFTYTNREAEVGFLSAILQDGPKNAKFLEKADPGWFFDLWHQEIYLVLCSMELAGINLEDLERLGSVLAEEKPAAYESHGGLTGLVQMMAESQSGSSETHFQTLEDLAHKNRISQALETGDWKDEIAIANLAIRDRQREGKQQLKFHSPSYFRQFDIPSGAILVGDNAILRGEMCVLAGAPQVGKSRALVALVVAGLTRTQWFGMDVPRPLKIMLIQDENGSIRLRNEMDDIGDLRGLDEHLLICEKPEDGMRFDDPEFRDEVIEAISKFKPDIVGVDPLTNIARDMMQRDITEAFRNILIAVGNNSTSPALAIVAHTRKPQQNERSHGRSLLNIVAGSYVIGSRPRSLFALQAGSDDVEDQSVVFTVAKNSNAQNPLPKPSAYTKLNGLFVPDPDFNWDQWYSSPDHRPRRTSKVSNDDVAAYFQEDNILIAWKKLGERIQEDFNVSGPTAGRAIKKAEDSGIIEKSSGFYRLSDQLSNTIVTA